MDANATTFQTVTPREAFNLLFGSIVVLDARPQPPSADLYPGSVALFANGDAKSLSDAISGAYAECVDCFGPDNVRSVLFFVPRDGVQSTGLAEFGRAAASALQQSGRVETISLVEAEGFVAKYAFLFSEQTFKIHPNEIDDNLFLGSQGCLPNVEDLSIAAVLTLTERPVKLPDCVKFHLHYHIADSLNADMGKCLDGEVLPWIQEQLSHNRPTLVHCEQGQSRSACVVVAHICEARNWKWHAGLAFVKNSRPSARPNQKFLDVLKQRYP